MTETLSDDARRIIEEEEELLLRVQSVLARVRQAQRGRATSDLDAQLRELREEAATATTKELPTLFADMNQVRALMERTAVGPLPDEATPYFAHLRLRTKDGSRDYLLGRASYANTAENVRVVDWRYAPIARIYYGYQEGDDFEETLPGGVTEGVVEARRVVVIERGALTRIIAGHRIFQRGSDGIWGELSGFGVLGGGAGSAARAGVLGTGATLHARADITSLLDAEQFDALSASGDGGLLVLGSAGSGKTTVALHRLSKLAFDDPNRYPPSRLGVIVPEPGLARLAKRLLEPLGLGKVEVTTLAKWLLSAGRATFGTNSIRLCDDTPSLVTSLKRHPVLREKLYARLGPKRWAKANLLRFRNAVGELFSDRTFLEEVVDAANGSLPRTCIQETARHTMLQLATPLDREYAGIDAERLQTVDGRSLDEGTPDALAGTIDPEDLALFLALKALSGALDRDSYAHLVLDEAEDFSLIELELLGEHLGRRRSITLAGDEMQQTTAGFAGWPEMLARLGVPKAATCRLQVSYRCPKPIAELAQKVLGPLAPVLPARAGREGVPVGFHRFPGEAQSFLFVAEALRDLVDREPNASIGVVASTPETAKEIYAVLDDLPRSRLVLDGDFDFEPGVDVTDIANVKGLEFDYVVLPDVNVTAYPATDEARRRLHVAVTRASHQLWIVSSGTPSPLVTP